MVIDSWPRNSRYPQVSEDTHKYVLAIRFIPFPEITIICSEFTDLVYWQFYFRNPVCCHSQDVDLSIT